MLDDVSWFILVWGGLSTCLVMFILVAPFKWKWILEAHHEILYGNEERRKKLLHILKEKRMRNK